MIIFFHILGTGINKRIDIDLPILPRVGEQIYIEILFRILITLKYKMIF